MTAMAHIITEPNALEELARFFQLAASGKEDMGMFSDYVDEAWHQLAKKPTEYEQFCLNACGVMVDHIPGNEMERSVPQPILWIKDYEQRFGALGKAWFRNAEGILDTAAYDAYGQTGIVEAAWRCRPQTGDDGGGRPRPSATIK